MKNKSLVLLAAIGAFCTANFHATVSAQNENPAAVQKAASWNDAWIEGMLNYNENDNKSIFVIEDAFRRESPANYSVWEERLIALWNNPKLTPQARHRLPILLASVITDNGLEKIAPSLIDPVRTHDAARVFSVTQGKTANKLLLDAYGKTDNVDCRICIVESLGIRGAPELLEVNKTFPSLKTESEQIAVIRAAGNFADERSAEFLLRLIKSSEGNIRNEAWFAFIKAADTHHKRSGEPVVIKEVMPVLAMAKTWQETSSLGFLVAKYCNDKDAAVKFLQKYFTDENQYLAVNMASYLRETGSGKHLDQVARPFGDYTVEVQGTLLRVFEDLAYQPAVTLVNKSIGSDDEWLAVEAINVAAKISDKDTTARLVEVLNRGGKVGDAAAYTLGNADICCVEPALYSLAVGLDEGLSKKAIDILSTRRSQASSETLLKLSGEKKYKTAALRALEKQADLNLLNTLKPRVAAVKDEAEAKALLRLVALSSESAADGNDERAKLIIDAVPKTNNVATASMLPLLPRYESNTALAEIERSLNSNDAAVKEEAFRALSNCKSGAAVPLFEKALAMNCSDSLRVVNFEAYIRTLLENNSTPKMNIKIAFDAFEKVSSVDLRARLVQYLAQNPFWGTTVLLDKLANESSQASVRDAAKKALVEARSLAAPDVNGEGFVSLFNGNLDGWRKVGSANYEVRDGSIVGICDPDAKQNSFLITEKKYANFIFVCDFKMQVPGNSGIQFRSFNKDNKVGGYQSEICDNLKRKWTCGLYDEGKDWIYPVTSDTTEANRMKDKLFEPARNALKPFGEWNQVIIKADGPRIQTWLNGVLVTDMLDNRYDEGIFGLQIHAGKQGEVLWKNIRLKELPKAKQGSQQ